MSKGGKGFFKGNVQVSDDGIKESHEPTVSLESGSYEIEAEHGRPKGKMLDRQIQNIGLNRRSNAGNMQLAHQNELRSPNRIKH